MDENVVSDPTTRRTPNLGDNPPPSQSIPPEQSLENPSQTGDLQQPLTQTPPPPEQPAQITPEQLVSPDPSATSTETDLTQTSDLPPEKPGHGKLIAAIAGIIIVTILILGAFAFFHQGSSSKKAKLVWWGLWEEKSVMDPLISDFQKENPNITVEYTKQDPKQYRDKLTTRIKNGTGPDIFRFHNTWSPMLSDVLLPFSLDVISADEFKKNYYPVIQNDLTKKGAIFGLPLGADSLSLFVNTEILESAGVNVPQNWDDFIKASRQLTVKDPTTQKIQTAGAALGTYGNVTHAPDIISLLFFQQGVDIRKFSKAKKEDKVDALNFYTSFAKGSENVWDPTLDESLVMFAKGNLAMYIGYSWDILRIQALNKDLKFSVNPVPQLVGRNVDIASYWAEGVSGKSPNKKAALLFMKYLAKKETAQKFYTTASKTRSFGEPYPRVDLKDSLKDNKLIYPFVNQLEFAKSSVFASDTQDGEGGINSMSNTYLGNAINAIINDGSSTQSEIGTLDKGMDQVYKKYGVR